MEAETEFLQGLLELQYGRKVVKKLKSLSQKVKWAEGWPEDNASFWNAEAFMWLVKIGKEKKKLIAQELSFLFLGRNLDLGCGAYSYIPSVGVDFSEKMLQFNEQCLEKVKGDLEKELPFENQEFDSVTAVFVFNYIKNYKELLLEIKRVLKEKGPFVLVLYSYKLNDWQRQKEVNRFSAEEWSEILKKAGFKVDFYEKEKLWFFRCSVV